MPEKGKVSVDIPTGGNARRHHGLTGPSGLRAFRPGSHGRRELLSSAQSRPDRPRLAGENENAKLPKDLGVARRSRLRTIVRGVVQEP